MTLLTRSLPLLLAALLAVPVIPFAQQAPVPVVPGNQRRQLLQPNTSQQQQESPLLSSNFRITFSGTSGDKSLGELSTLTCAPRVDVSGPLSDSEIPATFSVSGTLTEKEGALLLVYQISFSVPITVARTHAQAGAVASSNTVYQQHTSSGTLLMKPGKVYEVLKCGGNTYTITVSPEAEK